MFGNILKSLAILSVILITISLSSCRKKTTKYTPKGSPNNEVATVKNSPDLIAHLPIKIDSADYLLFPVGQNVNDRTEKKISYSKTNYYDHYLDNLIFQHIKTGATKLLSKKKIRIVSYEQLKDHNGKPQKIILYEIIDAFPIENSDAITKSLYIGTVDASTFVKVSPPNHHVTGWKYISENSYVYFTTIESSDESGSPERESKYHMYTVSLVDFETEEILLNDLKDIQDN